MNQAENKPNLSRLIPAAVALAMGVASIVLSILGTEAENLLPLLAIGVTALAFNNLNQLKG